MAPLSDSPDEGDNELSDIEEPLSKLAKKYKRERETSSDEENIPLMEITKRIREPEVNVDSYPSTEHKSVNEVSGQKEVRVLKLRTYYKLLYAYYKSTMASNCK